MGTIIMSKKAAWRMDDARPRLPWRIRLQLLQRCQGLLRILRIRPLQIELQRLL